MGSKGRSPRSIEGAKSAKAAISEPRGIAAEKGPRTVRCSGLRRFLALAMGLAVIAGSAAVAFHQYRVFRVARLVRSSFATRRYESAKEPLRRWLEIAPNSAEAHYYEAWKALAENQPREAVQAVDRARALGFDTERLDCLAAIYHARADRFSEAEPVLERAFLEQIEPEEMVAKELARIYLSTYRLDRAAKAVERWRALAPDDPQPCLWSNEIASRTDADGSILIQNYRSALERDPNLDQARLGLAQQLSKDRRFDEAEQEFLNYLKRKPKDTAALLGLGKNAFQQGNIEKASQLFEIGARSQPARPRDPQGTRPDRLEARPESRRPSSVSNS